MTFIPVIVNVIVFNMAVPNDLPNDKNNNICVVLKI